MNKQVLGTIGIAIALLLSVVALSKTGAVQTIEKQVFGGTSPDIASPYLNVGGVHYWSANTNNLAQGTTTVCVLQSPTATSTLISASFIISSTTAATGTANGAVRITMARSNNQYTGTSTTAFTSGLLGQITEPTWVMNYPLTASTTPVAGSGTLLIGEPQTFPPSTYLIVGMENGTGYNPTGSCNAQWKQITDN